MKKTLSWILLLASVGVWFLTARPAFLGGSAGYVMVEGVSMQPRLHTGDLVITDRTNDYSKGDVIAYRIPKGEPGEGSMVIHRIVGGTAAKGYVTQGDNREGTDIWRPTDGDVVGEMRYLVPKGGLAISALKNPLILAVLAGFVVFMIVAFDRSSDDEPQPEAVLA